jgi:hypothetical protein
MGKLVIIQFRRSRLPRRLINDGWWLESPPAPVIAFPKRSASKTSGAPARRVRHLTLVTDPGK